MVERLHTLEGEYGGQDAPLAGYAGLIAAFTAAGAGVLARAARGGRLPDRLRTPDLALACVATQHLARLIAKDRVTRSQWAS